MNKDNEKWSWHQVFAEEVKTLYGLTPDAEDLKDIHAALAKLEPGAHSALCLSGGGIRSASFALGVLQGLAEAGCLEKFRYLSTVSGGGYIGGWLSAWIHQLGSATPPVQYPVAKVAAALHSAAPASEPVKRLRASTNFLTPRLGLLSADWWTVIALFLRNLLLNWLVLVPLALAALMVPQVIYELWRVTPHGGLGGVPGDAIAAWVALFISLCLQLANRPSWGLWAWQGRWVGLGVIGTQLIASFLLADFALREPVDSRSLALGAIWAIFALSWVLVSMVRFFFSSDDERRPLTVRYPRWQIVRDLAAWIACGGLFWIGLWSLSRLTGSGILCFIPVDPLWTDWASLTFGLPAVLILRILCDMLFTGLINSDRVIEDDREWSGRFNGYLGIAAFVWTVLMAVSLAGGPLLQALANLLTGSGDVSVAQVSGPAVVVGGATGAVSAILSWSSKTFGLMRQGETKLHEKLSADTALILISVIFVTILTILLGVAVESVLKEGNDLAVYNATLHLGSEGSPYSSAEQTSFRWLRALFSWTGANPQLALMLGLFLVAFGVASVASIFVNINRFSQQGIYRNRLIRGFLGPVRDKRKPNPFTGFDERDNIAMSELWRTPREPRLFPIVNMTLNLAATADLAWQERKAGAFAATPKRVGTPLLGYRPTEHYAGTKGITLGMAMAISGAAVSPNQGYHSSPVVALLMTLFNVRLGAWLGNPKDGGAARKMGPAYSAWPLLNEAFLRTNDTDSMVYLSDGGHFENLGIYEAVRRRCSLIVVSDAGCDPTMQFADLGNAIRKIFIDFDGVEIHFPTGAPAIPARQQGAYVTPSPLAGGKYWAVADIFYPEDEFKDKPGTLIYLKPTYYGDESPDIRAFAMVNKEFPHDTTLNQWFTESQFESYRHLGLHCVKEMLKDAAVSGPLSKMV